ncbi:MAG: hypothetical protein HPKKFMNG_00380 [Planctomycetes bacterium]|nr:hypothetical protein [Planctomycetota bacterium]
MTITVRTRGSAQNIRPQPDSGSQSSRRGSVGR